MATTDRRRGQARAHHFAAFRWTATVLAILLSATPAFAGPPFVTDDPEPTDFGHWEIYSFVAGSHIASGTEGEAGLDINYGVATDVQITAEMPVDFASHEGVKPGDLAVAVKYRFVRQAEGSLAPDIAFFPGIVTPTTSHPIGMDRVNVVLPVWAQKDLGPWSFFGGASYDIHPGLANRNFWLSGFGVSRAINDHLSFGGEIYRQTADARNTEAFAGLNLGVIYKMTNHWSVLASAGPGIENPRQGGKYDFYFSLEASY